VQRGFNIRNGSNKGVAEMNLCFCRFILAAAILVLSIFFYAHGWARIVIIIAAVLLTIMSFFYNVCCCRKGKDEPCGHEAETPAE
jgi:VIT1/CCC1 family predicted Fe2+/Mn2+ transporter